MQRSFVLVPFVVALTACASDPPPPPQMAPGESAPAPVGMDQGDDQEPRQGGDEQVAVQGDAYADTDPSALTDFHATLDPHGTWVDDPTYGTIWVPNGAEVGPDFTPYVSGGQWSYDDDYVWESSYDWGWAPFHYGRWVYVDGRGWGWIPGREYAGAWVDWRVGPEGYGYVGWEPMRPRFGWRAGVAYEYGPEIVYRPHYAYVERDNLFVHGGIGAHVVVGERVARIESETHVYAHEDGHVAGRVAVRGPAPGSLGIAPEHVTHVSASASGVAHARAFARPSTAATLGAHPPSAHAVKKRAPGGEAGGAVHAGGGVRRAPTRRSAPRAEPSRGGGGHRR